MTDHRKPLEQAIDLAVFAPLGFALEARRLLPTFVERGKAQVNMAKVIGQFAVNQGQAEANKRVARMQEQTEAILHEFGIGASASAPVHEVPDAAVDEAPKASLDAALTSAAKGALAASPADLPIAAYDSLAASQVIPRLDGLSSGELDLVEGYELANRGRKTILGKIAQLRDE